MLFPFFCHFLFYTLMQLVAPRAVTIAVAILAIICTMNFNVSFFVIIINGYRLNRFFSTLA